MLPLRRPFPGGWPLLFLRRGLLAGFLLVRLVLWSEEPRTTAAIRNPPVLISLSLTIC